MIKLLLVDDHVLVRAGIREMLEEVQGISVVGEASTGDEGIELVHRLHPDLIVLDLKLPDQSGLEVTQKILGFNPEIKILIVSSIVNDLFLFRVLEVGAHGYITKQAKQEEFIQAIKSIMEGKTVISPQLVSRLALVKTDYKKDNVFANISERERAVMMMLIRGVSVKKMAQKLNINYKTVHSYRNRIFEKLNVKTDLAVTLLAIHHGLIILEDA